MPDNAKKLRILLEIADIPEKIVQKIEANPLRYQEAFLDAIQTILENEILNLLTFMEMKKNIGEKRGGI